LRRRRPSAASRGDKARQRPSQARLEPIPADEIDDIPTPTFVELGSILTSRTPRLAGLRKQFMSFIRDDVIPTMKVRVTAIEQELDRRETASRRSRLKVIEGGKQ
jgi:hypothetical protein